ncbi:MAG: tetratricopeptide repeat protein [Bacteroidales bacterium]
MRIYILILGLIISSAIVSGTNTKQLVEAQNILLSNPSKAVQIINKLLDNSNKSKLKNKDLIAESLITLGRAYELQGDFDLGLQIYHDALNQCRSDNHLHKAKIYLNLSSSYRCLRDFSKAHEYNEKATALYKSIGDSIGIAQSYNSRGLIHSSLEENSIAEHFFLKSLKINRKLENKKAIAANLNNLCLYKGNTNDKIKLLNEAIVINQELNAPWSLAENYNNMGIQYFYNNEYCKALDMLNKSMQLAEDINAKELICDNYRYKSWIYERMGNYQKAYEYFLKLYDIEQKTQSEKNLRNIERSMSQKALMQKTTLIELMNEKHNNDILIRTNIFLIIILFAICVITFILLKRVKEKRLSEQYKAKLDLEKANKELLELKLKQEISIKEKVEIELDSKKKDLTNFSYYIQSRNELLNRIKEQIKDGYKLSPDKIPTHLKKVNAFISNCQQNDNEISRLSSDIQSYDHEFLDRLSCKHPDLTKHEKHLATFLRIDLSSKDICMLTGANEKAVSMARYRLRKKLSIETTVSISDYLKNI